MVSENMNLDNKIAVITGAGSGIGRAGAILFSKKGAKVVVSDISIDSANKVVDEIEVLGGKAIAVECDVSSASSVKNMIDICEEKFGCVDVLYTNANDNNLVNNKDANVTELDELVFDRIHAVVLKGTFLCAKYAGISMIKNKGGSMIFTSTVDAQIGTPELDAYSSAKGGVISLTRSIAASLCKYNIRVNSISPCFVSTEGQKKFINNNELKSELEKLHMLGIPEAQDIVPMAAFLASDDAKFITGGIHQVDSGYLSFKCKSINISNIIS